MSISTVGKIGMNKPDISFLFGQRGTGKTTEARKLLAVARRALIFDPNREHDSAGVLVHDIRALGGIMQRRYNKPFRLVYCPPNLTQVRGTREVREFVHFCQLANAAYNVTVLADEIHQVVNVANQGRAFNNLLRFSRHHNNTIITVSHRPADVPRILTSLATKIYVFRTTEPLDLDHIKKRLGIDPAQVKALPDFHYLLYHAERGIVTPGVVSR